jgi:hypothetical protein
VLGEKPRHEVPVLSTAEFATALLEFQHVQRVRTDTLIHPKQADEVYLIQLVRKMLRSKHKDSDDDANPEFNIVDATEKPEQKTP